MSSPRVPRDIREFAARYLPSIEHLETFMLLQKYPMKSWNSREVAAELGIPEATADGVLERLASHNFLDVKISNDILYRYNPASADLEDNAARFAEFYTRERIAIIGLVTSATLAPIQDFAEAFRLKRRPRRG